MLTYLTDFLLRQSGRKKKSPEKQWCKDDYYDITLKQRIVINYSNKISKGYNIWWSYQRLYQTISAAIKVFYGFLMMSKSNDFYVIPHLARKLNGEISSDISSPYNLLHFKVDRLLLNLL